MSESVGKAYIEIRGDSSKLSGDMKGAEAQIEQFASTAKTIIASYLSYSAVKGFMEGMVGVANSTAEAIDELGDFSEVSGIAINKVSALKYAVEASGQSWGAVQGSIFRFSKALGGVNEEGTDTAKIFDKLGVKVKGMDGQLRPTEEVLLDVADKFKGMTSASEKTAVAFQLFGRGCFEIIPILNQGSAGIRALTDEAKRMNMEITAENLAMVNQFFKTRAQFEGTLNKIKMQLGVELMPVLGDLAKGLRDALLGPDGKLLPSVKSSIDSLVVSFRTFGEVVVNWAPRIVESLGGVARVIRIILEGYDRLESFKPLKYLEFGLETTLSGGWNLVLKAYEAMQARLRRTPGGMWGSMAGTIGAGAMVTGALPTAGTGAGSGDRKSFSALMQTWWDGAGTLDKFKASAGGAKTAVEELQDVTVPAFSTMAQSFSPVLGYMAQIVTKMYEAKKAADEALAMQTAQNYLVSSGIDWGAIEAAPDRPQTQLQGIGETGSLFPTLQLWEDEEAYSQFQDQAAYLAEFVNGGIFGNLGSQLAEALDSMRPEDFAEKFDEIMAITKEFATNLQQASEMIGNTFGNFVSDAAQGGFRSAMGKLIATLCQYLGKKLMMMGASMIIEGQGLIAMGMNPLNPLAPLFLAAGKQHIVKGAILVGAGAALMAGSGMIGNLVGGGGGGSSSGGSSSSSSSSSSFQSSTAEGYTYTMGNGTSGSGSGGAVGRQAVSITINAMDSQSFNDYLQRNGSEGVTAIMERSYRSNGSARSMRTWG